MGIMTRVLLVLAVFAAVFALAAMDAPPADAWYDTDWDYKREIQIDNAFVENENFTNYPMPIVVTLDNSHCLDNGQDILFVDNDDTTKLDHEIVSFDGENLIAWVRIPTLNDIENTTIYIYYSNSSAAVQENAAGVWDDNYGAVWHMDDGDNTSYVEDSTSNNYGGVKKDAAQPAENIGVVDNAQSFDGSDDYILMARMPALEEHGANVWTIYGWFRFMSTSGNEILFSYNADAADIAAGDLYAYWNGSAIRYQLGKSGGTPEATAGIVDLEDAAWHQLVLQYDGTNAIWYEDGAENSATAFQFGDPDATYIFSLGDDFNVDYWTGSMDEVRISDKVRSSNWIYTAYTIESNPTGAITIGVEETTNLAATTTGSENICPENIGLLGNLDDLDGSWVDCFFQFKVNGTSDWDNNAYDNVRLTSAGAYGFVLDNQSGLVPNTLYDYRAYVVEDTAVEAYGSTLTFTTDNWVEINAIAVTEALVDRRQDVTGSGATLTTTIQITVWAFGDNALLVIDNIDIFIYDNTEKIVVDNATPDSSTALSDNTRRFDYSYNPADNLTDDNMGMFDIRIYADVSNQVKDNWDNTILTVDDLSNDVPTQENVAGHQHKVSGTATRVSGGAVTLTSGTRVDNNEGSAAAVVSGTDFDNTYAVSVGGQVYFNLETAELDGVSDNLVYPYPNLPPDLIGVYVDNSLIDNHQSENAITATRITVAFQDNDNYDDFNDDFWIGVRDAADAAIDNADVTSTVTRENENYAVLYWDFDAEDNTTLGAAAMGAWDVWTFCEDNWIENTMWTASVFTVDELAIPINLSAVNATMGYSHGENILAAGTMTRVSGTAISLDNSWLKDENEGEIILGTAAAYSENWIITSVPGAENIYVRVWAYDGVLDGENFAYYDVNENRLLVIYIRYEDGDNVIDLVPDGENENTIENQHFHLTFYHPNGSTREYDMENNPENYVIAYEVLKIRLEVELDNYWRMRIPPPSGTVDFYIPDNSDDLYLYEFTLRDVTGAFGKGENGAMYLFKYYWDNLMYINEDYWELGDTVEAWLIYLDEYQVKLVTEDYERSVAPFKALTELDIEIVVGPYTLAPPVQVWNDVSYAVWWDADNYLRVSYQDNQENTITADVTIYDENGDVAHQAPFTTDNWALTWTGAEPTTSYTIQIEVYHENYGSENLLTLLALPYVWNPPLEGDDEVPGVGQLGDFPLAYGSAIGIFFVIVVGLTYGRRYEGLSILVIAMILVVLGPIYGAFTLPDIVIPLIAVIGIMVLMIPKRGT